MNVDSLEVVSKSDSELVAESLLGNHDAFGALVTRYQSAVSAVTYSAVGDLTRSEDIAQETFLQAWKSLRNLKEPSKIKAWLCGIARNLAHNAVRREVRQPIPHGDDLTSLDNREAPEPSPSERTISNEEQSLMWRALADIPETYREPMVLFYREQQSIERVAVALDLSEDAVKQRLSRGRKLLSEQMATLVEGTLRQTAPGRAFTYGVLAALPMFSATASAATIGTAAGQGTALAKSAGILSIISVVLGPLAGILGAWFGVRASLDSARTEAERNEVIRCAKLMFVYIIGFLALLLAVMLPPFWRQNTVLWATVLVILWGGYAVGLFAMIFYITRRLSKIRNTERAKNPTAPGENFRFVYQSKIKLFGIPLVHVNSGRDENGRASRAVGWVAIGDFAYGLIACGGFSVGVVSLGGAAVGIFSFGGAVLGGLAMGGLGVGYYVLAGLGVGIVGFGGLIIAWQMAVGGLAIAHEIALGGLAQAQHANDAVARAAVQASAFMQKGMWLAKYGNWLAWLPIGLVIWQSQRLRRKKRLAARS
jgi:RNA polymerase sigma factor (sigma-70 family)